MRRLQEQAWLDHDHDYERELQVLTATGAIGAMGAKTGTVSDANAALFVTVSQRPSPYDLEPEEPVSTD